MVVRKRKTFVEKKIERLEQLSDEELLDIEKKMYKSSSLSSFIGLVVFIVSMVIFIMLCNQ